MTMKETQVQVQTITVQLHETLLIYCEHFCLEKNGKFRKLFLFMNFFSFVYATADCNETELTEWICKMISAILSRLVM